MAGRRPGTPKTGGRQKGVPNKATAERKAILSKALDEMNASLSLAEIAAMAPRDVMLWAMRLGLRTGNVPLALTAAEKAAPYVHARLSNVEMNATVRRSATDFSDAELAALAGDGDEGERAEGDPEAIFGPH